MRIHSQHHTNFGKKWQPQNLTVTPPFCPTHYDKKRSYCQRPQTCEDCMQEHVDGEVKA